jgi:hypothetical protein
MVERGYTPDVGSTMPQRLQHVVDSHGTSLFTRINSHTVVIPVGENHPTQDQIEVAVLAPDCLDKLARSLRPFLLSTGDTMIEVDGLINAHRQELRTMSAQMVYRMTWAERC